MNFWLDDVRPKPSDDWVWAKTVEEAQEMLVQPETPYEIMSLDHDLGAVEIGNLFAKGASQDGSGYDVVQFMVAEEIFPTEQIILHSWSPPGASRMAAALRESSCPVPVLVQPYRL